MNWKQRRIKGGNGRAGDATLPPQASLQDLLARAGQHLARGDLGAAANLLKRALAADPGHLDARERLASVYLAQDRRDRAAEQYVELIEVAPQFLGQFARVVEVLKALIPPLAADLSGGRMTVEPFAVGDNDAARRAWTVLGNAFFQAVLKSTIVRDAGLEIWLTTLRATILRGARGGDVAPEVLSFMSALAQQCFLNEYVFSISEAEQAARQQLEDAVGTSLVDGRGAGAVATLALAMYGPLADVRFADALASAKWPQAVSDVVTQQIVEPATERGLRSGIRRLTAIDDDISAKVRNQYEENPYPRWVRLGGAPPVPLDLDDYVRQLFPVAPFRPVQADGRLDVLVAGCGTGRHALELAQSFQGAQVLGIDLSVASLAAAKRRIPPRLSETVEFAQADILGLRGFRQTFDFISAGGVLHHMADALEGWRILLELLRSNGLMQVALYSKYARRGILEAREMIARRGYRPTPEGIRHCRADLRAQGETYDFMSLDDFFSTSDCRDLLFHVHESQFTIPQLKAFFADNDLRFIGFQFSPPAAHQFYRERFARSGWSFSDLDRWDAYERDNPALFAGMYVFWVQKAL